MAEDADKPDAMTGGIAGSTNNVPVGTVAGPRPGAANGPAGVSASQQAQLPPVALQTFTPLPTGTKIGELTVQAVLGAGDWGITYITEHEGRGKRYALKEFFPRALVFRDGLTVRPMPAAKSNYGWGLERFIAEARGLQKVRHPAIVAVHGVTEAYGTGYIGMAYEQGRDFGIWLHELRRLPTQDELDKLAGSLLDGIALLHAAGLQHQDLSPDNLLVREDGSPVVVDPGGCRSALRRRVSPGGAPKHAFVAPEEVVGDGGSAGPATDIYALAGLLYLAVTGKAPPPCNARMLHDELVPAGVATEGRYRADFLAAIDAGLQFRPGDRPQTIAAWREPLLRTNALRSLTSRPNAAKEHAEKVFAAKEQSAKEQSVREEVSKAAAIAQMPLQSPGHPLPSLVSVTDDGRPDEDDKPEELMANAGFRSLFFGVAGLFAGAIAGALSSILVAALTRPECFGDHCVGNILPIMTAVGGVAGAWLGVRHARGGVKSATETAEY